MTDRSPVLRIITSAAQECLKPLGLARRGRSRLWIDDHGWWLGVVEFTPPRMAGSGLHVGAMWQWHDVDHLAFHVDAVRIGSELFRTEGQFTPVALGLGRQAAANVTALREKFPHPTATTANPANPCGHSTGVSARPRRPFPMLLRERVVSGNRLVSTGRCADAPAIGPLLHPGRVNAERTE
ncbi:hypothetical protein [Streptomyces sp. NPDC018352]|uniref:hypothetical protein n=1 Tax=Streptomyces sp. NPDC018352 TaxID=3157194 RepID=UPI0033CCB1C1